MSKTKITAIYEDDDLIIVNKPSRMLTIPDRFDATKPNLFAELNKKYGKIYTVHRLDKETSGLICFAKNEESHRHLSQQFQERTTEKFYHAFVIGVPFKDSGIIDNCVAPDERRQGAMRIVKKGKQAITHWSVVKKFNGYSILEAKIETGRMHQIRLHFQSIGHPLVVDSLYSPHDKFMVSSIKRRYSQGKWDEERPLVDRSTLHAKKLTCLHPKTGKEVTFEVPYPKDLLALDKQLSKYAAMKD